MQTNLTKIRKQIQMLKEQTVNLTYEKQIAQITQRQNIADIYQLIDYFENYVDDVNLFKYFYQHYEIQLFARPSVTIDLIYLRYNQEINQIQVLLKKRQHEPFKDTWSLYGSFLKENESINEAVLRQCQADLGFTVNSNNIIRLPAVSKPGRDPRMWVITNPNIILLSPAKASQIKGEWTALANNFETALPLAFDHQMILENCFDYLKADLDHQRLPYIIKLLEHDFTLPVFRNLLSLFDSKFKKQATSNIFKLYKNKLIKTGKKQKQAKGSKGGANMLLITYKNF